MDLIKLITDKVKEVETSGKLDEIIEKHVLSTLDDIVNDSFRWSGEAKKSMEEGLKGKLGINFDKLNVSRYQKMVTGIVEEKLNSSIDTDLAKEIEGAVVSVMSILDKKEWKLSEIIQRFIDEIDKSYDGEMEDQYGELSLHVDLDGDFCHVYFDKESEKRKYECNNKLFIYKGNLSSAEIDRIPFTPKIMNFMDRFGDFLFKLYCNNVTIIIDENRCQTEYYREDCD